MHNLPSLTDRLYNPNLSRIEYLQREAFISLLSSATTDNAKALSVSCGDGIFDYLALKSNGCIQSITATDIVPCPVKTDDAKLLNNLGDWKFQQVKADTLLPFADKSFDLIWHQDVLEHTEKPYLFISEQFRVLRGGER